MWNGSNSSPQYKSQVVSVDPVTNAVQLYPLFPASQQDLERAWMIIESGFFGTLPESHWFLKINRQLPTSYSNPEFFLGPLYQVPSVFRYHRNFSRLFDLVSPESNSPGWVAG